ncbi:hypothetical protein M5C97_24285 [Acidovorax sp. NCPPB 3859]|nr:MULTISPECIES: hypothetical protein [unclassified Acidovorax]MDA8452451.1 hypothetical protein [Acidovorax sp. GBBC 3297]MDA8461853.1 hypothetical protein [Acidovorax sp. GBBC 3333]MDA8466886.1 hypothetical protein [Acidovorax sp. GBBC 3332]MDA8471922.1 hypothetical protein [Acidovorax sp. GBBC 3299]WCM78562.1 hypothetical protein M5C94_24235 [Acidovorax sp. GBBC 712]
MMIIFFFISGEQSKFSDEKIGHERSASGDYLHHFQVAGQNCNANIENQLGYNKTQHPYQNEQAELQHSSFLQPALGEDETDAQPVVDKGSTNKGRDGSPRHEQSENTDHDFQEAEINSQRDNSNQKICQELLYLPVTESFQVSP